LERFMKRKSKKNVSSMLLRFANEWQKRTRNVTLNRKNSAKTATERLKANRNMPKSDSSTN
jgi:hypothetical protein